MPRFHSAPAPSIPALLAEAAKRHGDRVAVEEGGDAWTYAQLRDRVARLAAVLRRELPESGARVAILAPNSRLYLEAYHAAAWAGRVLVPLNIRAHVDGLARILRHAAAGVLLVHDDLVELGCEAASRAGISWRPESGLRPATAAGPGLAPAPVQPADPAQIYYTSGTTGEPKGVVLTHENVCHHAAMARRALELDETDVFAHIAPMFHLADAWATFAVTEVGGRHRMVSRFEPEVVLDELADGVTTTNLVPTMLSDLCFHPTARRDYPGLRRILSGGAPIDPALVRRILDTFGCEYVQTYGLTETAPFLTMSLLPPHLASRPEAQRLVYQCKTGRPLAGVEVRVVGEDGKDVPPDGSTVGEIVARGPSVTPGYWKNPSATAAAFRDGWLHTGDLAVLDDEGFLDIVDRKKDVILSGGETLYSTEIEKVVSSHPKVRQCAVVGVPHERWGEAVLAVVVPTAEGAVGAGDLLEHCRGRLGHHQVPKAFELVSALPRTGSGKIAKRALRDTYEDRFTPRAR